MKKEIRYAALSAALILTAFGVFGSGQTVNSRTNMIFRPCSGSTTPASVKISTAGAISLTPCSGQTISIGAQGYTLGSIPFANASGVLTQNNSKLFWDNTNFRMGIGTASPAFAFDLSASSSNSQISFGRTTDNIGSGTLYANSSGVFFGNSSSIPVIQFTQSGVTDLLYGTTIGASASSGTVRLKLPLAAGQTANAFEVRDSGNVLLSGIDQNGIVFAKYGAAVASAAALVPSGNTFHVTGNTNITSITSTGITAGTCIVMIFDGTPTVTDGSNLKLAGNFDVHADDTISLCYDGTNWYETARSIKGH